MNFASDNVTGACPEVLQAIVRHNDGAALPYGEDPVTTAAEARLKEIFETDLVALPVATGTACNAIALSCMAPPYGAIYCHRDAHIHVDECGAPELFTGGAKLIPLDGDGVKLTPDALEAAIIGAGVVHHPQPAAVSLSQGTEGGTLYSLEEIAALSAVAKRHGLKVHMDGARFANALVALGCAPAEMTWQAGVDVLSFGATKNGCLAAEALIFFDKTLAADAHFRRKRAGQLLSKMRFVSAQIEAYLDDEVWLRNAHHANAMAVKLSGGLCALPGVSALHPTEINEVFCRMPQALTDALLAAGFVFYDGYFGPGTVRLVCAWNTSEESVDALLAEAGRLAERGQAAE